MTDTLYAILRMRAMLDTTVSLRLLRARNLPLIASFLYREYKTGEQISVPYLQLVQRLADYLELIEYRDEEEEEMRAAGLSQDFEGKARWYLDRWIEAHYLRNLMDDERKEPLVFLSQHVEKVFQVLDLLRERAFVGTESRFKDIFAKLRDIIEHANPDKERRLAELQRKKQAIIEEIRQIRKDGYVPVYEDYQIRSRYEEVNRLANELIGDFKEVEDNFREITRRIYERQQQADLSKGKLLSETFDALHELRNTDQGKSFYAFWQFMLDDERQAEFRELTREVYEVMEERGIPTGSRTLRKLKTLLHLAARKVLDKNNVLADKLSREIVAKDQLESRKTREQIAGIRQLALQLVHHKPAQMTYLTLEGNPEVYLPLERKLGERPQNHTVVTTAASARLGLADLDDLSKIYRTDLVDRAQLLSNIRELLQSRTQVSLREVVQEKGLTKGLAELLAYVTLVQTDKRFFVNEATRELIEFDPQQHRWLDLPQVVFSR
ncbi:MAG: DUF3375 domain-containing protein [Saprospiraceae bacterium]|nr:DUF3375 domain-containing protein [Saprospiraceae bacterium]